MFLSVTSKFIRYAIVTAAFFTLISQQSVNAHPVRMAPTIIEIHPQKTFITAVISGSDATLTNGTGVKLQEKKGDEFPDATQKMIEGYVNHGFWIAIGKTKLLGKLVSFDMDDGGDLMTARFNIVMRYERTGDTTKNNVMTVMANLFEVSPYNLEIIDVGGFSKTLERAGMVTIDPSQTAVNLFTNIRDFMWMGMHHIFTGPDHMLFILGLLMASSTLRGLIKTLTGFTIAHSITLALSALNIVTIPNHICDILIALSIIYVGVENMIIGETKHRFWIASAFSVVHGFGFSDVLRNIGMPHDSMGWCLMSFNLGVEVAQVILCCIAFPLLLQWRKGILQRAKYGGMSWPSMLKLASCWVVALGGYFLIQRTMGL